MKIQSRHFQTIPEKVNKNFQMCFKSAISILEECYTAAIASCLKFVFFIYLKSTTEAKTDSSSCFMVILLEFAL